MSRPIAKSWEEWIGQEDLGLWEIAPPKTKPTFREMEMLFNQMYRLFRLVREHGLGYSAIEKRSDMENNVFSRAIFIRDQILKPEHKHYNENGEHIIPAYHTHTVIDGFPFPIITPLWNEWEGGLYAEEIHEWELDPRYENREELLEALEASKNLTPSEELEQFFTDLRLQRFHDQF